MNSGVAVEMLSPWEEGSMRDPHIPGAVLTEERLDEALQDTDFSCLPVATACKDPAGGNSLALNLKHRLFLVPFVCWWKAEKFSTIFIDSTCLLLNSVQEGKGAISSLHGAVYSNTVPQAKTRPSINK